MRSCLGALLLALALPAAAGPRFPAVVREPGKVLVPAKPRPEMFILDESLSFDERFGPFSTKVPVGTVDCLPYNDLLLEGHPALAWRLLPGEQYASGWNYHVVATAGVIAKGTRHVKIVSLGCPPRLAPGSDRRMETFVNRYGFEIPRRDLYAFDFYERIEHAHALGVRDLNMSDLVTSRANRRACRALGPEADDVLALRGKPEFAAALARLDAKVRSARCALFWFAKALERHPDILLFVAAGNDGLDNDRATNVLPIHFGLPNVVVVAAAEDPVGKGRPPGGKIARCETERGAIRWRIAIWPTKRRSSWGKTRVELAASATGIMTTVERYRHWSAPSEGRPSPWFKVGNGTSLAAPTAAALSAKLRLVAPRLGAQERKELLALTSDVCPETPLMVRSGGVLNPERALAVAKRLRDSPALRVREAVALEVGAGQMAMLEAFWAKRDAAASAQRARVSAR